MGLESRLKLISVKLESTVQKRREAEHFKSVHKGMTVYAAVFVAVHFNPELSGGTWKDTACQQTEDFKDT